jgi:hypothetical protein
MALGGVLYYDPEMAPEPGQDKWSIANPFDLTYNPFRDPKVLKEAEDGRPVPLALYTYQSNMALKPIITIDFFRPNNPRLREAATYWRRLGNEAIASASIFGLFYNSLRRAVTFAANRKGLTWFSDSKVAMGVEELRLSLMNSLYFHSDSGGRALDRIDRLVINPLVQSGREQRLRAQLQYQALLSDGGQKVLETARKVREKLIRKALDVPDGPLSDRAYQSYREHLNQQRHLDRLRVFARDAYLSSVPVNELIESVTELGQVLRVDDRRSVRDLVDFSYQMTGRATVRSEPDPFQKLAEMARLAVRDIYRKSGKNDADLAADLKVFETRYLRRAEEEEQRRQKGAATFFRRQLARHLETLQAVVENQGDPFLVSPWYVSQAARFLKEAPEAARVNPWIRKVYQKKQPLLEDLAVEALAHFNAYESEKLNAWLTRERALALSALESLQDARLASYEEAPSEDVVEASPGYQR